MKGITTEHLLACEIVHKIEGRVRIRIKALKYLGSLKSQVEKQLEQVKYIKAAKISLVTGTVVIYFDSLIIDIYCVCRSCKYFVLYFWYL